MFVLTRLFLFGQHQLRSPFGAFLTLLYGLTAAPASQPKSALLGQTIALGIAIGIGQTPMSLWLKQSIATALAVTGELGMMDGPVVTGSTTYPLCFLCLSTTAMVKLGITHPPAGAAALIYSSGTLGWGNMLFMLLGNLVGTPYISIWIHEHGFSAWACELTTFSCMQVAIGLAALINNWSDARQYPTYWGVFPFIDRYVETIKQSKKAA